ncbi:hypothetical protein [Brachyspira innocens]|uniref:hypothetical protein n=1 Tax=Brachyspira innocens TaxID=13264 RepID=UPI00036D6815|nr:hypothetical protein [Brachyspira innocens]
MQEKSQKDKCKDWTQITGIIYATFDAIEKQLVNDKMVIKVFESFKESIKCVNNEFNKAYNNDEYEGIEFPPYRIDDYTQLLSNINLSTTADNVTLDSKPYMIGHSDKPYNVSLKLQASNPVFNWKEFVMGIIQTIEPLIVFFTICLRNEYKYGALYTSINGLVNSIKEIKEIIAK